jgi:hypothetical protein
MIQPRGFRLYELGQAPESPGVYAWYYQIELSNKDIEDCIERVLASSSEAEKSDIIRVFLERRLFKYYQETPYRVMMRGPMKPTYAGTVENQITISSSLIERLSDDPKRLLRLKELLQQSIPFFSSPIYIGVAKNLRSRLLQHKYLIERFRNAQAVEEYDYAATEADPGEEADRDHSFAQEVSSIRNFTTHNLLAYTMSFAVDEDLRVDLENILNRINYPLCGRK